MFHLGCFNVDLHTSFTNVNLPHAYGILILPSTSQGPAPHCFYARAFLVIFFRDAQTEKALVALLSSLSEGPYFFTFSGITVDVESVALFYTCCATMLVTPACGILARRQILKVACRGECKPCLYKTGISPGTPAVAVCPQTIMTPLVAPCSSNFLRSVPHVLLHGAAEKVNVGDAIGCRPLHFCVNATHILEFKNANSRRLKPF